MLHMSQFVVNDRRTRKEDITSQNCCRGAALRYVLHHDDCLRAMVALSQRQFNEENVLCWLAIEDYKRAAVMDETGAMVARARDVIQRVCWPCFPWCSVSKLCKVLSVHSSWQMSVSLK